ncbi:VOC family protein [Streptomyces sp. VRA16 Mangrove soil]|uniref:VOC family protein n=1 Tax=Streptomyces sp. VRA16 Mangrove soil TaxID=2817434 RepID=UPI001A9F8A6B|nr:VOC family protein [Streptomyces sp. VRA16 Mangrove soil]MBO1330298.1 VOC family protein [Streptomyces sp. VRA16 Mangrove soil]
MSSYSNQAPPVSNVSNPGAPCWVNLSTHDLRMAETFYRAVLGWEWRTGRLGDDDRFASVGGVPVAGVSVVGSECPGTAWTPFFATQSAHETEARSRERGGTTAVGPLSYPYGRAAVLADRDGAVFGIWEGELMADWEHWRRAAPASVELHTRDAFDAAIFYAEVLGWGTGSPGCCEVDYEDEKVVLRSHGVAVARIYSGAVESAPDPAIRPRWQVHFAVEDVEACMQATRVHGGKVLAASDGSRNATLSDPDGALFAVTESQGR